MRTQAGVAHLDVEQGPGHGLESAHLPQEWSKVPRMIGNRPISREALAGPRKEGDHCKSGGHGGPRGGLSGSSEAGWR